jgi:polyhydroxyalkanoate synthesis repressor PhaR
LEIAQPVAEIKMPDPRSSIGNTAEADQTISIVRYPNRRLYDRSQARYVTLQEIADMVREGKTVTVTDSKSDADLTGIILTQIILEHHPERMSLLPVPILHLMIRTNDIVLDLLRDYFRRSMLYLEFWQQSARLNPMAASMEWFKSLLPPTRDTFVPEAPASSAPSHGEALSQRIAQIERRIQALEPATESRAQSRPGARRKRSR